ncbi:hypothetical protein RB1961 [Rhodopirellula baltica SH 1]|uniref:Uncharacterized protein n=1 Tax=Rhodopirellula baltica (strain DSM 10527 / NCIMB 13988 / SH1) TaxID=243090 RepID=Q7UWL1_RHOBA|nr:hypothetical protein RB1961 [Rhodopirellula baltica SH 1]
MTFIVQRPSVRHCERFHLLGPFHSFIRCRHQSTLMRIAASVRVGSFRCHPVGHLGHQEHQRGMCRHSNTTAIPGFTFGERNSIRSCEKVHWLEDTPRRRNCGLSGFAHRSGGLLKPI